MNIWYILIIYDIGWSASHTSSTFCDSPRPLFLRVVEFVTLSKYKVMSRILWLFGHLTRNSTKHLFLIQRSWASSRVGDHLLIYFFSRLGITIPPCGQSPWGPHCRLNFKDMSHTMRVPCNSYHPCYPYSKGWRNPAGNTPFSKYGHLSHYLSK